MRYIGLSLILLGFSTAAHAEEDRKRKDEAEIRNTADGLVYQTEKLLKDPADAVSDAEKSTIAAKLAVLAAKTPPIADANITWITDT